MNRIKDGGPAFPREPLGQDCGAPYGQQDGMSLRDWFAGQALAGGLLINGRATDALRSPADLARSAYIVADAMIAAREGGDA